MADKMKIASLLSMNRVRDFWGLSPSLQNEYLDFSFQVPVKENRNELKNNTLTDKEINKIIESTKNIKHKILLELVYHCGIKISEAVKIKFSDINLKDKILKIENNKHHRTVSLPSKTCHKIEFLFKIHRNSESYIFSSCQNTHISVKSAESIIKESAERAGINKEIAPETFSQDFTNIAVPSHRFPVFS